MDRTLSDALAAIDSRPTVTVGQRPVWSGGWEVTCTEHGTLDRILRVPASGEVKAANVARLRRLAYLHAEQDHDGDVHREGWV